MSVPQTFAGKTFAVTGAASGIGKAIAIYLFDRGASLSLADVQKDPLGEVAELLHLRRTSGNGGGQVLTTPLDVRDAAAVESWIKDTHAKLGPLDGAANIAGIAMASGTMREIKDVTDEQWDRMIGVNLTGLFYCLRAQLQPGRLKDGASIVNAGSMMSLVTAPYDTGYSASKHGVLGLTRSVAKEAGIRKVRANCICPGSIETPILQSSLQAMGLPDLITGAIKRHGQPEEVAALVGFLLGDESKFISGAAIPIDGASVF